jgi:hypothetical protein
MTDRNQQYHNCLFLGELGVGQRFTSGSRSLKAVETRRSPCGLVFCPSTSIA